LEAREQIEEAQQEEDLVEMKEENDERIRKSEEVLEQAFKDDDIDMAKGEAVKLRYWINIKESIDGWERGKPVVLQH
jgi:molecular chaperone HscB